MNSPIEKLAKRVEAKEEDKVTLLQELIVARLQQEPASPFLGRTHSDETKTKSNIHTYQDTLFLPLYNLDLGTRE
jgi:hypothetical protein